MDMYPESYSLFTAHEDLKLILSLILSFLLWYIILFYWQGLFSILRAIRETRAQDSGVRQRPLLLAPYFLINWIRLYSKHVLDISQDFEFIPHSVLLNANHTAREGLLQQVKTRLCLTDLQLCQVLHTKSSAGLVMQHNDGWKLVYSGDTMPCETLVKAGRNCDILIHEATFNDVEIDHALKKASLSTMPKRYSQKDILDAVSAVRQGMSYQKLLANSVSQS
ncbi:zinc phosphodiesterase ELAC protein 2-like [Dreissena polymorpha]|uniref:zinc phosphodiesterase ELAC protein 2-like n=1 Tax=Dreissena polymorpha TaxID=45954 RepID=UPI002263C7C7|nr:zinc phosphodiesterase ELAC protein 2-like [Dreissena polymorpha]